VAADYKVATSGVQNVLFQLCPTLVSAREVDLNGEIGFENPYGCVFVCLGCGLRMFSHVRARIQTCTCTAHPSTHPSMFTQSHHPNSPLLQTTNSYLPGRFFGYLPFEGARFFAFLFFDLAFFVAFVKNRRDLLRLHWAILLVRFFFVGVLMYV